MSSKRLIYVDSARGLAVFLSLLAHVLLVTNGFALLGDHALVVKQFTRSATPLFVVLFGFLIESVYVRRIQRGELDYPTMVRRCAVRSIQCLLAYAIISLASVFGGYRSVAQFMATLGFFSHARFGNIFRVYAVLLMLVPTVVWIRIRWGEKLLPVVFLLVAVSCHLTAMTQRFDFGYLSVPANILFGLGHQLGGPSIWHSLAFVAVGMFLASDTKVNVARKAAVILLFSAALGAASSSYSFHELHTQFANGSLRARNQMEYFILGSLISCATIVLLQWTLEHLATMRRFIRWLTPYGKHSFLAYTLGNIALNLFGKSLETLPCVPVSATFLLLVWIVVQEQPKRHLANAKHHARQMFAQLAASFRMLPHASNSRITG